LIKKAQAVTDSIDELIASKQSLNADVKNLKEELDKLKGQNIDLQDSIGISLKNLKSVTIDFANFRESIRSVTDQQKPVAELVTQATRKIGKYTKIKIFLEPKDISKNESYDKIDYVQYQFTEGFEEVGPLKTPDDNYSTSVAAYRPFTVTAKIVFEDGSVQYLDKTVTVF